MLKGLDISYAQGMPHSAKTDQAFRESDFIIMKATQGVRIKDNCFDYNYRKAKEQGKLLGTYHYAEGGDAVSEARFYYDRVKDTIGEAIPCLDWEPYMNAAFDKDYNWARRFVDEFHRLSSKYPFIYTGPYFIPQVANCADDCKLWLAGYPDNRDSWTPPNMPYKIAPWSSYAIWQYTSSGGILDRDVSTLTREEWIKIAGGKSSPAPKDRKSMACIYRPNIEEYLVFYDGSKHHVLHHPDEVVAINKVHNVTVGGDIPIFELGTKDAPWATRFDEATSR